METNTKSITIVITTHNEEKNIKECIESAHLLTNNIVVVDTESTDKTTLLAQKSGATVATFPYSTYVEPSRQFSVEKAHGSWVFIMDADERMTKELAQEIHSSIGADKVTHYKVRRKNLFAGMVWLRYGGWYSQMDYQTRLISKKNFVDWPKKIHSTPQIKGEGALLQNPLLHFFHSTLENMVEKTIIYEDIESDLLFEAKKKVAVPTFFRKFAGELYRRLIKGMGYRDGTYGVIESIYQAYSKTITYLFLYEKYQKSAHN